MKCSPMTALNRHNPLTWLDLLLLAWLVLGVQLAAPKPASGPFYAATEHHLGVTRWEAAPRLGLDAWTTKSASGDTVGAKGFVPAERTGLNFEAKVVNKSDGYVDIELSTRQKFDKTGAIVDSKFAQSDLVARYSPDGNLRIDWYGTTVSGKGVGTEMVSRAIESIGPDKVKAVSAQLGNTNLEAFRVAASTGLSREQAVWSTPLGKTMKALDFKVVEISGSNVKFLQ